MTSASHAEGRQFDPGQVYVSLSGMMRSNLFPFCFFFLSRESGPSVRFKKLHKRTKIKQATQGSNKNESQAGERFLQGSR
jgi:hypothetical protein